MEAPAAAGGACEGDAVSGDGKKSLHPASDPIYQLAHDIVSDPADRFRALLGALVVYCTRSGSPEACAAFAEIGAKVLTVVAADVRKSFSLDGGRT